MILRAPLATVLLTALAACAAGTVCTACAAPRAPAVPIAVARAAAADDSAHHHSVALAQASLKDRPSETTKVTEDHPDPEAQRLFQERMAQAAVPLAATTTPPKVTALSLDDTRRGEAPEMKATGDLLTATLAEGQRATTRIKLGPGECETFIAQGGLGVIEVDLFLTAGDGPSARILAEDPATGPIAVIGGYGKCFAGAPGTGTDAILHAAVRRGAGVVLVQAYRK
jgi:hypothetical protein